MLVDDAISRRLKNTHDYLIENLNNYHEKIKFSIENNPKKFLDIRLLLVNDLIKTEVYPKAKKCPIHWKPHKRKTQKKCNKWRLISLIENQLKFFLWEKPN